MLILFLFDLWYVLIGQKYNFSWVYIFRGIIGLGGFLIVIYFVDLVGGYQFFGCILGGWDVVGNWLGFMFSWLWLFNYFDLIEFCEVLEVEYDEIEREFDVG